MTTQPLEQQTYLPDPGDGVAEVLSFIKARQDARARRPAPRYFLAGAEEGDQIEIPQTVYRVLVQVLEAMQAGKAVTVAPQSKLLTTQQAADLVGVSRPTLVKLLDAGELPAETPGKRRRMVKLDDVLAYRLHRRQAQYRALLETSVDDYELEEAPEAIAEDLRRVRAEVAAKRRARAQP